MKKKIHADGTGCLEGTKLVPVNFSPCCDEFAGHLSTCAYDLRYEYWKKSKTWVIAIAESAGGGGIVIRYCPHCGNKLNQIEAGCSAKEP
jgi:hypothetical protein